MKLRFIIFLMVIIVSLSAQISDPIEINGDYPDKKSSGQRAYQIIDGIFYITYQYQYQYIYFTKISDQNNQTHIIIDTLDIWYDSFTDPAIQVLENGDIIIVYSEIESSDLGYLKIARSTDDGESFSVEAIEIINFGDPHIVQSDDGLDICYSNSLQKKSLAEFQHFTEFEATENADGGIAASRLPFSGSDELYGPVHSNDDIWVQQAGGGTNNGWPTFHSMVTTAGRLMHYPSGGLLINTAPMDDIFLGGWEEEIEPYEWDLSDLHSNSIQLGTPDTDIVYVKLHYGVFDCMFGEIEQVGVDTFGVYSWFPHNAEEANAVINNGGNWYEDADHIWTNQIAVYDTNWTGVYYQPAQNQSFWIDCELWIEGSVYGAQTWASSDTIYIVGDITYDNTPIGSPPDDPIQTNLIDYFGLVSEERIFIRYKHKDPFNNMELRDDNCDNIMLYGAYAALGVGDTLVYGDMACHYDGLFTPQYQHPHGSTPNFTALSPYTLQETLYTYVDLHKYVFPQSVLPPELAGFNLHGGSGNPCGFPNESNAYINSYPNNIPASYIYPHGTDYPWYNPVWPESSDDIVFERGQITMFGSLAQTRRGYTYRSGSDPYNHPDENEWDLDEYHFDGNHPSTGYNKNYYGDARFAFVQPPNFPRVIQTPEVPRNINVFHSSNNGQNFSESHVEEVGEMLQSLWMDSDGESVLIAYQTATDISQFHFLISDDNPQEYEHYVVDSEGSKLKNAHILGDEIYVLSELGFNDQIYCYQIGNPIPELIQSFDPGFHLSDFTVGESGALSYVHEIWYIPDELHLDFLYNDESGTMAGIANWAYPFNNISYYDSEISIQLDENNTAYSTILLDSNTNNYSQ
ncbi:MAG: hypothetical protein J7K29_03200, partial [Candidatus Cloacimonetes bacterium]|nr:hypothetical protein [Candidatus Cloacimonadota bacterium]